MRLPIRRRARFLSGLSGKSDAHCRAALEASMSTLIIFFILALATIGVLVWAVIEDDRDERGRK